MPLKANYRVETAHRKDITEFIEQRHYSHSINGCISDYCFKIINITSNEIEGACFYGRLAMANQWEKYTDNPDRKNGEREGCDASPSPSGTGLVAPLT